MYIGVDVGGTFTDLAVNLDDGRGMILHKLASTPEQPARAVIEGVQEILERNGLRADAVRRLSHGTTVGTNALIQRRCGKVALVTSEGFRDLLEIGRQIRPRVYDIHLDFPPPLVERHLRFEVPERRRADGTVHVPLDEAAVAAVAQDLRAEAVDCVVVCFLHSYAFPEDEDRAAEILRQHLPEQVTVLTSASVYPEFREYERFSTAVLNAALITIIGAYLDRLISGVEELGILPEVQISQSSGGLMSVRMARQLPIRASLSGPAAGVQGAQHRAVAAGLRDIITLDAGGTSADVSLLRDGQAVEVHERELAGFPIRLPALDVNAVGAGGGSIAWVDRDDLLKVGPHSAGAVPGPACYGQGGEDATVTDANVVLGRLNGDALLDGRMPIDRALSVAAIAALAARLDVPFEETALGIVRVACATMVKAIRSISIERGHDPRDFTLFVYGGAGPLHATDVARELGIETVVVPPSPGILCAEGVMNAPLTTEFVQSVLTALGREELPQLRSTRTAVAEAVARWFEDERVPEAQRQVRWSAELRYFGQNYELSIPLEDGVGEDGTDEDGTGEDGTGEDGLVGRLTERFHQAHEFSYGFSSPQEPIQVVNLKAKAIGALEVPDLPAVQEGSPARPTASRRVVFALGGSHETPVFRREDLVGGQVFEGPAIVEQMDATVLVFPGDRCTVDRWGNLVIELAKEARR